MIERTRGPIPVSVLRIGRTEVGGATAVIDDDILTMVVRTGEGERSLRLKLVTIDAVVLRGEELVLSLRDGTRVSLLSPAAHELHDELTVRCRTIPEVTRTLRAFGSRRGPRSERGTEAIEQQRFFAPLMESRRQAVTQGDTLVAFDAPSLARALDATLHRFAAERHGEDGPACRALEAELVDISEPLYGALRMLGVAAAEATASADDLRLWHAWSEQLRKTFEVADRVWSSLDIALETAFDAPSLRSARRP